MEKADAGDIIWNVGSGAGADTDTDASRSLRISAVFQEDRLCPSFSPLENVMMVQKKHASEISGISRDEIEEGILYPSHEATDFYHHYKEDIALFAEMGFKTFRMYIVILSDQSASPNHLPLNKDS